MNKEEIDKWLDNEYGCSYTRLEELHDFLIERNMKLQDELDKYKNIVDELEKFLQEDVVYTSNTKADFISGILKANRLALSKLKELKGE